MKRDIFDFVPKDLANRPIAEDTNESLKDRPTTDRDSSHSSIPKHQRHEGDILILCAEELATFGLAAWRETRCLPISAWGIVRD